MAARGSHAKHDADSHSRADTQALLRSAGLRVTQVRLAVMQALSRSRVAMSAADVIEALETGEGQGPPLPPRRKREPVDKVTVYRTLNALVEANLAHKIDPGDRVFRYSLTDHARCTGEQHDHEHPHVICERCGVVECLDDAEVLIRPRAAHGTVELSVSAAPTGREPDRTGLAAGAPGPGRSRKDAAVGSADSWSPGTALHRFRITRQEITLRGTCEKCLARLR